MKNLRQTAFSKTVGVVGDAIDLDGNNRCSVTAFLTNPTWGAIQNLFARTGFFVV